MTRHRYAAHFLAVLLCFTVQATPVRTVDGDTFVVDAFIWLGLKSRETVRVLGVNTPEIHGATKDAGMVSRQFTVDWLAQGDVTLTACSRDAFGRVLAVVSRGESNLGKELISNGLGVEYRRK